MECRRRGQLDPAPDGRAETDLAPSATPRSPSTIAATGWPGRSHGAAGWRGRLGRGHDAGAFWRTQGRGPGASALRGANQGGVIAPQGAKIVARDASSGASVWTSADDVAWSGDAVVFATNGDPIVG